MFIVNVEGAIYKEGKWLLVKRSEQEEHGAGGLALVGGQVDQEGNSSDIFERTLIREIDEEVGIEVTNLQYVNSSTFISDTGKPVVDIVFVCDHFFGEPYVKCKEELDEVIWMTTEEILNGEEFPDYLKRNITQAEQLRTLTEQIKVG
ncbi:MULTISPECIES: NUDIX domain-containing protein [unclassified Psychrobacillus]|uniref:NUDIX domain-containing protein n=1 Tax=unclassified Psychrobacillus TaxID=2636677 RepID=UPI00146D5753|nr:MULTISPECIES: NUDIX domain-containing protein [unclassified Psychrobacillus]MCM3357248.1 NUDIX domain-containing protein [Psychrobacillus sp. MER TA 171]NME04559.1 NUDIX domain-containing protein [Psychrobacillus sp. BL-248-WT-3]